MTTNDALHDDLAAAYGRHLERRRGRRRKLRTLRHRRCLPSSSRARPSAAATLLGWPAPEHVKKEIAAVDRGLPEDFG